MEIPVLLEPVAGNGFRARGPEPFALVADGSTPELAIERFRKLLQERLAAGVQIVPVHLPETAHPLTRFAGTLNSEDPLVKAWEESMAEYRKKIEEDPDYL
jgi:hypothetical protein